MSFVGPFSLLAVFALSIGGYLLGSGHILSGIILTALGAGWNGILLATMQRIVGESKTHE